MARIEWTQEFEIGIPVLDTQQHQFVEFINELDDACRTGDLVKTNHVMEGLLHYTVTHFELEEELLEKAEYPYLKAHRRVHEVFMKKVSEIRARSNKGEDVSSVLLELLKGWLKSHIQREDRDFVESVKKITESADVEVTSWLGSKIKQFMS
jgi:hemerythrin